MENLKTKSENYQNTDENREKFVKEFNENVLDLEKLNDRENAFKVERELENGQKIDFYTLRGGKFNLLVNFDNTLFYSKISLCSYIITNGILI